MFRLPDLSQAPFHRFRAQIDVEFAEYKPEVAAELRAAFVGKPFEIVGIDRETHALHHSVEARIEPEGDSVSIEIDIYINTHWEAFRGLVGSEAAEPNFVTLGDVELTLGQRLAVLSGLTGPSVGTECRFAVDESELPVGGIILRGLHAQTRVGSDTLRLSGAKFAINVNDPRNEVVCSVSWFVEPSSLDSDIFGSIDFRGEVTLVPELFTDVIAVARQQFDRYVLQVTEASAK
jgi:hypothetical protein